jgi:hypothetical protein
MGRVGILRLRRRMRSGFAQNDKLGNRIEPPFAKSAKDGGLTVSMRIRKRAGPTTTTGSWLYKRGAWAIRLK